MRGALSLFVAALLSWVAWVRTENFSPEAIRGPWQERPFFLGEIREKLAMPYHYLSSGRQAYVFVSEDGTTVLKFFKKAYYSVPWYAPFLPWKEEELAKRQKRREFYLHSYTLAAEALKEGTGLLFVGQGKDLPHVRVCDKAHRWHEIDLNKTPFVLQKRGEPLYPALLKAAEEGTLPQLIDRFLFQIAKRIEKGIADGDQDVEHNFGTLKGEILHLDPGRLFYAEGLREPVRRREEWESATYRFRKWLLGNIPEIIPFFDERIRSLQEERSPLDL